MRVLVLLLLITTLLLPKSIVAEITLVCSAFWAIYTVYICVKLVKYKDKKIVVKSTSLNIPNDNYASHIRYLYKKKVDNRVLICSIFELLLKGSISLKRINMNDYYFVDNNIPEEVLSKNEKAIKKMLFTEIGNTENVSLARIIEAFTKNSGYMYTVYKSWRETFIYECVNDKYFKSIKPVIDDSMFYFVLSMIIVFYNILFVGYPYIFLPMFLITSYLVKEVNDLSNMEEEAKEEYKEWLKLRNYLKSGKKLNCDINELERYSLYSYALDTHNEFKNMLYDMYVKDNKVFDESVLLSVINTGIFDDIAKEISKSINICKFKAIILSSKNKGRRV